MPIPSFGFILDSMVTKNRDKKVKPKTIASLGYLEDLEKQYLDKCLYLKHNTFRPLKPNTSWPL